VQSNATWGIDRIDQRRLPLDTKFHYLANAGTGVTIYIVDTGVNIKHVEFKRKDGTSRASWGITVPTNDEDIDNHGHGTHVAGTTAGKKYGIAKNANVVAVKVLGSNGSGTLSDVIKGIEWVVEQHKAGKKRKSVANMSLGGGKSRILEVAVDRAVDAGVHFAVAAGNENADACYSSPAGAKKPITVGATDRRDTITWFSNTGKCVDILAPGLDITSAWIGSPYALNTISGTSMASPHVAGAFAAVLSSGKEFASTTDVKDALLAAATKSVIKGVPADTVNKLLYLDYHTF
jgi:cerevisin